MLVVLLAFESPLSLLELPDCLLVLGPCGLRNLVVHLVVLFQLLELLKDQLPLFGLDLRIQKLFVVLLLKALAGFMLQGRQTVLAGVLLVQMPIQVRERLFQSGLGARGGRLRWRFLEEVLLD